MELEEIVMKVMMERGEFFIPARSPSMQESLRTAAFHIRRKAEKQIALERMARKVSISKAERNGELYVRIGYKDDLPVFVLKDGKMVLFTEEKPAMEFDDSERIIFLMRKEGRSEEEIAEYLKGGKEDGADAEEN